MPVTNQTPIGGATGNGVTTVFPFSYYIAADTDLVVKVEGVTKTLGVDYTVSGAGNLNGGTITMSAAPANGERLAHYRDTQLKRDTDYQDNGDLLADVINLDFDRLWLALQEIFSGGKGAPTAVRVPAGETIAELPAAADRANRILGFGSDGQLLAQLPAAGDATALAIDLANKADPAKGPALSGFNPQLNYTANTIGQAMNDTLISVLWFDDVRTAVEAGTDCTAAVQAVYDFAIATGRKRLFFPAHSNGYLFAGAAGADTYANGLLCRFTEVNFDPTSTIVIEGEGGTIWKCGSDNMILLRIARNCVKVRDITLDYNGRTGVILCGIVPESMTQTTTLVSQSFVELDSVSRVGGPGVDGIVIQPGPRVLGADSGCFYHNIIGGASSFIAGGRHVYLKKSTTWAVDANRATRTNFIGQRLVRGNIGFDMEVGSEINLFGCHEELINSGVTPSATPVARRVSADCSNINFYGGYSEACTKAVDIPAAGIVRSWGYIPASGSDLEWIANVESYGDATSSRAWTPVVVSSGGGAEGASTSTGYAEKIGRLVKFNAEISVAKGTLAAGQLSITGLPFVGKSGLNQGIEVSSWSGITFTANVFTMAGFVSGAGITLRKLHAAGAGPAGLTLAECSDPIVLTVEGEYLVD